MCYQLGYTNAELVIQSCTATNVLILLQLSQCHFKCHFDVSVCKHLDLKILKLHILNEKIIADAQQKFCFAD